MIYAEPLPETKAKKSISFVLISFTRLISRKDLFSKFRNRKSSSHNARMLSNLRAAWELTNALSKSIKLAQRDLHEKQFLSGTERKRHSLRKAVRNRYPQVHVRLRSP